jgi:hypothetical protein
LGNSALASILRTRIFGIEVDCRLPTLIAYPNPSKGPFTKPGKINQGTVNFFIQLPVVNKLSHVEVTLT